jgi:hypothetical protein
MTSQRRPAGELELTESFPSAWRGSRVPLDTKRPWQLEGRLTSALSRCGRGGRHWGWLQRPREQICGTVVLQDWRKGDRKQRGGRSALGCGDRNRGARDGDSLETEMRWHWVDKSSRPRPFIGERGGAKWGDWVGVAHGRAEWGCIGHTRLPRTASWQRDREAAASCAWSARGGDSSQGCCLHALVLSDVAARFCSAGHVRQACAKR